MSFINSMFSCLAYCCNTQDIDRGELKLPDTNRKLATDEKQAAGDHICVKSEFDAYFDSYLNSSEDDESDDDIDKMSMGDLESTKHTEADIEFSDESYDGYCVHRSLHDYENLAKEIKKSERHKPSGGFFTNSNEIDVRQENQEFDISKMIGVQSEESRKPSCFVPGKIDIYSKLEIVNKELKYFREQAINPPEGLAAKFKEFMNSERFRLVSTSFPPWSLEEKAIWDAMEFIALGLKIGVTNRSENLQVIPF
jgi:hypothetical protein